jgi:hypothetical protein
MHRKPELVRRGSTQRLGVGKAIPREVLRRTEWVSAVATVALQVFSVGNIVGCTHVIPVIATCSKTGDGQNEQWIVNSHIDLATWNDVYN